MKAAPVDYAAEVWPMGVDWREELRELPEQVRDDKRVLALAFRLQCVDHRIDASIESRDVLQARREKLLRKWEELTSPQLDLFTKEKNG